MCRWYVDVWRICICSSLICTAAVVHVVGCSVWQKMTGWQSCIAATWPVKSAAGNHILWPWHLSWSNQLLDGDCDNFLYLFYATEIEFSDLATPPMKQHKRHMWWVVIDVQKQVWLNELYLNFSYKTNAMRCVDAKCFNIETNWNNDTNRNLKSFSVCEDKSPRRSKT